MKGLWGHIKAYLRDEEGQTSMEYILILALVAAIIYKLRGKFDENMNGIVDKVFNKVNDIAGDLE